MAIRDWLLGRSGQEAPALLTRIGTDPAAVPAATRLPQTVPYLDGNSAVGLSAVWRCVTLIADLISRCEWQEWNGLEQVEPSRLVQRPAALMSRRDWVWKVVATEALHNTAYTLHVGGRDLEGRPWSLLPLPPLAVTPGPTDAWQILPPSWYRVAGQHVDASDMTIMRRNPWPGTNEALNGILQLARREFAAALAADVHLSRYWQSGGPVTTQITTDQELTNPEADNMAQRWVDRRSMGSDWPAVFGKGAKAEPYGADPTTESAVESRKEMVADIGRYFGVPSRILNAPTGSSATMTYANVEDEATDLTRYTLDGYAMPIEDAITGHLSPGYLGTRRMVIDMSRVMQGNLESRSRAYPPLVAAGIMTADEARARGFGLPPLTSGDTTPAVADTPVPAAEVA